MKSIYSLVLIVFLISTFSIQTSWADVTNEAANQCLAIVGQNKGNDKLWLAKYDACLKEKGVRQTSTGKYVQSYHYDNDKYKSCIAIKSNNTPEKVDVCMKASTATVKTPVAKTPTEIAPVTASERSTRACDGVTAGDCVCTGSKKVTIKDSSMNSSAIYKCDVTVAAKEEKTVIGAKFGVDECLAGIKYYVDACTDDAAKAVSSCDPDVQAESNSDSAFDMKNIFNAANNLALKKGAGSGAYETCLQTALITQAGYYTTEQLKQTCEPQVDKCKASCATAKNAISENNEAVYLNCRSQAMAADPSLSENEFESQYGNNISKQLGELNTLSSSSSMACGKDAADYKAQIEQASNDFNNAAKQAQVCRCQTGSTGEDCNAIKGPAECALNPNAVGCAQSTVNCNNSDSLQCRCVRNPNLAECKPGNNGGPSAFANANTGFKPTTKSASPKISSGDFDISFDEESNLAAVNGTEGSPTSPFGSAQAGGTGGGSGGGAGAAGEGDPAAVEADGKGGLNHLLDKAKTLGSGLINKLGFGGGSPNDKKYGKDGNGKKIDPSKWKPGMLRGVAGDGSEIGPKHRDIWKQMNSQYFLQEKTFLQEK